MSPLLVPMISAVPAERPDEADTASEVAGVAGALAALGYATEAIAVDLDFTVLDRLARMRPLVVFNLVESLRGDGRLGYLPVAMLEHLGLAFTGSGSRAYFLANSKLTAKQVLGANGLPTPEWWTDGHRVPAGRRVIVKAVDEHASLGMDHDSVVSGTAAAPAIARRERQFATSFFAEEYVEGPEFNVSLIEDRQGVRVLPIPEMTFDAWPTERPRIVDYEAKWSTESAAYDTTRRRFGLEAGEPGLARDLARLAESCWHAFGLRGYARIDFRTDLQGRPTIIDVNANPCLAGDAGFAAAGEEAGIGYRDLVAMIVHAAIGTTARAA